jgi:hypothetical protein
VSELIGMEKWEGRASAGYSGRRKQRQDPMTGNCEKIVLDGLRLSTMSETLIANYKKGVGFSRVTACSSAHIRRPRSHKEDVSGWIITAGRSG